MISLANYMATIRRVTFLTTLLFSFIVLCLSAALTSLSGGLYSSVSGLALATSLLTLLAVGSMFFVDMYRKGTYFSYIVVEVSCLSILWILWLSSGASAAQKDQALSNAFGSGCSRSSSSLSSHVSSSGQPVAGQPGPGHDLKRACHEIKALVAFSFLTWILVMFYTVTLLVLALRARSQGHNVWEAAVRDDALLYTSEKVVGGTPQVVAPQSAVYQSYPLAQQSPPPPAQQYISPPTQQYITPPAQQYTPLPAQQYTPQPAQQYIPQPAQQYIPPPVQQSIPTSVPYVYPAQV